MNEEWDSVFSLYVKQCTGPDGRETVESSRELTKRILSLLPTGKCDTAIDIGSGWGSLTIPLAEKVEKVTGLEPDKKNIQESVERIRTTGAANVSIQKGSFERLHYEGTAAIIASSLAFHQVRYRKKELAIKNIKEHLAPGGIFILCDLLMFFDPEDDSKLFNKIYRYILPRMTPEKIYEKYSRSKMSEPSYIYTWADMKRSTPGKNRYYSIYDLRSWLGKQNMIIEHIDQISPFFGVVIIRSR